MKRGDSRLTSQGQEVQRNIFAFRSFSDYIPESFFIDTDIDSVMQAKDADNVLHCVIRTSSQKRTTFIRNLISDLNSSHILSREFKIMDDNIITFTKKKGYKQSRIFKVLDAERCKIHKGEPSTYRLWSRRPTHKGYIAAQYVYALKSLAFPDLIKIGRATDVSQRMHALNTSVAPSPFYLVASASTLDAARDEHETHQHFQDRHVNGEFFRVTPEEIQDWFDNHISARFREEIDSCDACDAQTKDSDEVKACEAQTKDSDEVKAREAELDAREARLENERQLFSLVKEAAKLDTSFQQSELKLKTCLQELDGKLKKLETTVNSKKTLP